MALLLGLIFGLFIPLFGQALKIENTTVDVLNICGDGQFEYQISNQRANILDDINLTLICPDGVEYVSGSLIGAQEIDISDVTRPIFQMDLMTGEVATLRFSLSTNCGLYAKVQQAASFINRFKFVHPDFSQIYEDDPPYAIATGLLVIDPIPDIQYISGAVSQRDVVINNTRLGPIDKVRLVHLHGSLDISTTMGTVISQTDTELMIELDSNDFKNIGNGDGILDNNERFIYSESLDHQKCEPEIIPSEYQVFWGCDDQFCQSDTFSSDMIFNLTSDRGRLRVRTEPSHPECPCLPEVQCMTFQNFGAAAVDRLRIFISAGSQGDSLVGVVSNSYYINAGNVEIDSIAEGISKGLFCTPEGINRVDTLYISALNPGESFELCFLYHQCKEFVPAFDGESVLWWNYGFDHFTLCRPDDYQFNFNNRVDMKLELPLFAFEWDGSDEDLVEGVPYEARWLAKGDILQDSGLLMFRSCVPCGLSVSKEFSISNGAPIAFSDTTRITNDPPTERIDYYFDLPFDVDSVVARMTLTFSCEEDCLDSIYSNQVTEIISSCNIPVTYSQTVVTSVCGDVYMFPCIDTLECGYFYQSLPQSGRIKCEFEGGSDTARGYIIFDASGRRFNYGLSDENDDRRLDGGSLDTSKTRQHRLGYSDTVIYSFAGDMHVDLDGMFDTLSFIVQPYFEFEGIDAFFKFKDFETGELFECYIPELRRIGKAPTSPVCCRSILTDGGFAPGAAAEITAENLALYGCPFTDFELTEGDSVFLEMRIRNVTDARQIYDVTSQMRVEVYDRSRPSARFSCGTGSEMFTLSFQETNFTVHGDFDFDACSEGALQGGFLFTTTYLSDNFFQNEFRQQLIFSDIFFEVQDGFIFDSLQVLVVYKDSSNLDTLRNEVLQLIPSGNFRLVDSTYATDLIIDEGANIYFNPFITIESCEKVPIESEIAMFMTYKGARDFEFAKITRPFEVIDSTTDGMKRNFMVKRTEIDVLGSNATVQAFDSVFCKDFIFNFSDGLSTFFLESSLFVEDDIHHQIVVQPDVEIFKVEQGTSYLDIPEEGEYTVKVCYSNTSCLDDSMDVAFYWTCSNELEADRCYDTAFHFDVKKLDAELEMEVFSREQELHLCDTSDWIEIEFYNAELGTTYELIMDVTRGLGLDILPGTLQYQHPFGSGWQDAPLSIDFNGLMLRWDLIELLGGLEGLPGISFSPSNRVRLRFRAITGCNYVSGGFFTFSIDGVGPCGVETNAITKNSEVIAIANAPEILVQEMTSEIEYAACCDIAEVRVVLISESATKGNEVIDISLPSDGVISLIDFAPIENIEDQEPELLDQNMQTIWRLQATEKIGGGDSIVFSFRIEGLSNFICDEMPISILSKTIFSQYCDYLQEDCDASIVHAGVHSLLEIQGVKLSILSGQIIDSLDDTWLKLVLNRDFSHDTINTETQWTVYVDENGNGAKDSLENTIVGQGTLNTQNWDGDSICQVIGPLGIYCHYHIVYDGLCACERDTQSVIWDREIVVQNVDTICAGDSVYLGYQLPPNSQTRWLGDSVGCDTCPFNWIYSEHKIDSIYTLNYQQFLTDPAICDRRFDYEVVVMPPMSGEKEILNICRGDSIHLASGRGIVRWIGNGVDSFSENLTFRPDSSFEIIAISDLESCGLIDTICVQVLDRPQFYFVSEDTTFLPGDTIVLEVDTDADSIVWFPGQHLNCANCPIVESTPDGEITYYITGIDKNGCDVDTQITLRPVAPECEEESFFIPNAFSPNGDKINDTWRVLGRFIERIHVVVYNRWGEMVFESFDKDMAWDGSYQGKFVSTDVFAYAVQIDCVGGERFFQKGNISLIR